MRSRVAFGIALLAAFLAAALGPWLAFREAQREAYGTESEIALGYARELIHRADETAGQALAGIRMLAGAGLAPCSAGQQALMRRIDLLSTHVQGIGRVRDGTIECASVGAAAISLDPARFRTSTGILIHRAIRVEGQPSRLIGIERDGYIAFVHRDLPLDTWTAVPGVSLALLHLEGKGTSTVRGHYDPAWVARMGTARMATFTEDRYLVAAVRSERFLTAALAAVPIPYLEMRTREVAMRLVPAGLLAGLAVAAAILSLARKQHSLPAALRKALRSNEFFVVYQPLVDLRTGAWVGAEALLRWRRGSGEMIGPDLFIPVAEQAGLITHLTERVLQLVEADAGRFLARHRDFHVAINLSAADLGSERLVSQLDALLARSAIRPSNLMMEITEHGFVDPDSAGKVISALRARGIAIAIDDFGTGYSSLQYLESLDVDFLKIDRAFIEAIGTGAPTSQVVGHIITMARAMKLRIIAEGVERAAQAEYLEAQGVQLAQGWMYAKGMPFSELENLLAAQRQAFQQHADAA